MDISKMYCRVDSEHFDEFVKLVGEQLGALVAYSVYKLSEKDGCIEVSHDGWVRTAGWHESNGFSEFAGSWTIYNNTKPLSELSDEQAGKLVKHSGEIESLGDSIWYTVDPDWGLEFIYRAKQKSERELFVDLATEIASDECETERIKESIDAFIVKLFGAGFKAPKGGE